MAETLCIPVPARSDIAYFDDTHKNLNDGVWDNLFNTNSTPTSGDATWTFQWDLTIAPASTILISKDKLISPVLVPSSVILLGTGLLELGQILSCFLCIAGGNFSIQCSLRW